MSISELAETGKKLMEKLGEFSGLEEQANAIGLSPEGKKPILEKLEASNREVQELRDELEEKAKEIIAEFDGLAKGTNDSYVKLKK